MERKSSFLYFLIITFAVKEQYVFEVRVLLNFVISKFIFIVSAVILAHIITVSHCAYNLSEYRFPGPCKRVPLLCVLLPLAYKHSISESNVATERTSVPFGNERADIFHAFRASISWTLVLISNNYFYLCTQVSASLNLICSKIILLAGL